MNRYRHSQLELFSSSKGISKVDSGLSSSFLKRMWGHEKIILIIIGFLITGIVSFSLGVEKGKRLAMLSDSVRETSQPVVQKQRSVTEPPKAVNEAPKVKEPAGAYTIQVASYQGKQHAQKEMTILKQKGLLPLILSEKGLTVLCVGNFQSKEMAKSLLSELKKRYRDCYVRRL